MVHPLAGAVFALALGVGIACQLVARHLRFPSIVLLLAAGVALGPDGVGWIDPEGLGKGLLPIVSLAVAVILFEGGLGLRMARLRGAAAPIRRLVTGGALVTAGLGGTAAHLIMGWPIGLSALFGTLVIVTGPTVIRPLVRHVSLRPRLATVLEAEGLLIDPIGAMIAAVALQLVLAPSIDRATAGAFGLVLRLAFGTGAGAVLGAALVGLLRWPRAVPEGFENLVALGGALVTFVLCEQVLPESGILAVTVAGVVVGNLEERIARALGEFQEQLTVALIGLLFVLLAADVRLAHVAALGSAGWLTVAVLCLVVRPVVVALATAGSELDWREKTFLAWVAPRGVVAAAVASLAAAVLVDMGRSEGNAVRALVFLTIAVTVVVQGGTASLVARLLGVRGHGRDTWVVLGAEELAFALADALRGAQEKVLFVDTNPSHCRAAEERRFAVVYGDAFNEHTRGRLRLENACAAIGLTPNAHLNLHFVEEAQEEAGVPAAYVALERDAREASERIVQRRSAHVLFDRPKDVERWNVRFRHGLAEIVELAFQPDAEAGRPDAEHPQPADSAVDDYVLLAYEHDGRLEPMAGDAKPLAGARVVAALHTPEREIALSVLADQGYRPAPPEEAPEAADSNDG